MPTNNPHTISNILAAFTLIAGTVYLSYIYEAPTLNPSEHNDIAGSILLNEQMEENFGN